MVIEAHNICPYLVLGLLRSTLLIRVILNRFTFLVLVSSYYSSRV